MSSPRTPRGYRKCEICGVYDNLGRVGAEFISPDEDCKKFHSRGKTKFACFHCMKNKNLTDSLNVCDCGCGGKYLQKYAKSKKSIHIPKKLVTDIKGNMKNGNIKNSLKKYAKKYYGTDEVLISTVINKVLRDGTKDEKKRAKIFKYEANELTSKDFNSPKSPKSRRRRSR